MGLLISRGPPAWHPSTKRLQARCAAANKAAADRGLDIAHLAMAFCLWQPDIVTTMTSTTSVTRLQGDIDMVTGVAHTMHGAGLAEAQAAVADIRGDFFSGPEYEAEGLANWEGVEPAKYWRKVGQAVMRGWYITRIASQGRVPKGLLADGETLSTVLTGKNSTGQALNITAAHFKHVPDVYADAHDAPKL